MAMAGQPRQGTRVQLPPSVQRPFEVFVNGVPQVEGRDYVVRAGALEFGTELASEGKVGAARWTSMFLGISGTYRKNDTVDVVYTAGGRRQVATGLRLEPIDE
jgi:hypothetical protein